MKAPRYILLPRGGYCYGVEAAAEKTRPAELHGGFTTFADAAAHRDWLLREYSGYEYAYVVKIETPAAVA